MAMRQVRVWIARCDEPECPAEVSIEGSLPRWDAGLELNDRGWQAAPSYPQTFCPDHFGREVEHTTPMPSIFRNPPERRNARD